MSLGSEFKKKYLNRDIYDAGGNQIQGALDWDQLLYLSNTNQLNQYTMNEFGLGEDFQQYITPISQEPFELLGQMQKNKLGQVGLKSRLGMNTMNRQANAARQKSNLAFSGGIESQLNQSKNELLREHDLGVTGVEVQTRQSIFDEEQRQLERFYDDIGAIMQLDAMNNSGGGKK